MDHPHPIRPRPDAPRLSRRVLLRQTSALAAAGLIAGGARGASAETSTPPPATTPAATGELQPLDALRTILDAFDRFPLVALGEHHQLQEFHDVLSALVFHPEFPDKVNDVVVEFGNARYQDVADRFVVA